MLCIAREQKIYFVLDSADIPTAASGVGKIVLELVGSGTVEKIPFQDTLKKKIRKPFIVF